MEYRIEEKFLCSEFDYYLIKSRIQQLMEVDKNASENNEYIIKSIYFDDVFNTCYNQNEDGVDIRSKYRIRCYNNEDNIIRLERKDKKNGYTHKESCLLTKEEYTTLLKEDWQFEVADKKLLNELNLKRLQSWMKPSAIVEYTREAYIYEPGNVRVTFDKNMNVSQDINNFFEEDMQSIPILDDNQFIVEVKYDEFLHKAIESALDTKNLYRTTFSKFYLGKQKLGTMTETFIEE